MKNYKCIIDWNTKDMQKRLSPEGYSLVQNLLEKDPKKRFSCAEALHHPWFAKFLNKKIPKNLDEYEPLQVFAKPKINAPKRDKDDGADGTDDNMVPLFCKSPVMAKMANFEAPTEMDSPNTFKSKNKP